MVKIIFSSLLFVVCVSSNAYAAKFPETPGSIDGVKTIDHHKVDELRKDNSALVVDFRTDWNASIPSTIHCKHQYKNAELSDVEIDRVVKSISRCEKVANADKSKPIVAFCSSKFCWLSPKASLALKKMGFRDVYWYRLGFKHWLKKGMEIEE